MWGNFCFVPWTMCCTGKKIGWCTWDFLDEETDCKKFTLYSSGVNVANEVKQIMEEAVTKKFVHEDSSHIIALCTYFLFMSAAAIEACLSHLLKRRAAGFLRSDKIAALFTKVGKVYDTAGEICRKVQEQLQQQADLTRRAQSVGHEPLRRQGSSTTSRPPQPLSAQAIKHIWVRTALFEKVLDKIVQHIVDNSSKYYEREALMHDPVFGPILAALLVGPCALEYTKLKTSDHFWTDPSANELVQRHRIHGAHRSLDVSSGRRPALGIRKRQSSGSMSEDRFAASAREYVESLHQNSRTHLLYGKNNVLVQPKKDMEVLRGYLSLHQAGDNLTLKWTPNQLINGTLGDCDLEKSIYWDYALTVPLRQIVCIHCHQRPDCGGTLVLVSQDGIQRPPLHFPPGGHLLAFLSCLETGLLPRGQLEPPLWSQKGKGKVFPKLRKRSSTARLMEQDRNGEEQTAADYVFRIVYPGYRYDATVTINYHHTTGSRAPSLDDDEEEEDRLHAMISMICSRNLTDPNVLKDHGEMMEMQGFGGSPSSWQQTDVTAQEFLCQSCSAAGSNSSFDYTAGCTCLHQPSDIHTIPLKMLCQNMKRQIVSRAFYGWLAYCRHLSTVRTHLSAMVTHNIVPPDRPCEASGGLSKEVWSKYQKDCKNYKELELLRLVYYGGVQHEIRKEVWPFLLGHYKFGMSKKDMSQIDVKISERYQQVMREWKACEVIVKQREKEMQSAIFAKLSSGSSIDSHVLRLAHRDSTLSNEVFMSMDEPDAGSQETPSGEDSTPVMTTLAPPAAVPPEERPLILSSIDDGQSTEEEGGGREEGRTPVGGRQDSFTEDRLCSQLDKLMTSGAATEAISASLSSYTIELLDMVALNLHRIDKDVQRCDRNYYYFTTANLEKLRNIMCSYVWEHLEMGYVQGMCDLLAPLMVILDDESLAYSCFTQLMKRMSQNFPNGGAMDTHFANMRSLIQILDSELFELMQQNGDYTHFYFCYRWFLLDFKRELLYEDVFAVWEVIWVAPRISSRHFVLFLALALVTLYREIIIDNNMDFTDIIKFFNEMAERHDVQLILRMARELVHKVQSLMDNK
ncbi:small G protein signaling modulator 2 isoform X4 [Xiphophorus hellerii]|uniref:small G protein signaling modulator 2 isoform X4 n=1 Tax=Xiphophorus hellerii TaxID=8084 RepID=UPI0013B3EABB|nr:small G protein signaling modulator 2 isoform X4 [Xiphophorus hellerii]